jgi:hypothetical protein
MSSLVARAAVLVALGLAACGDPGLVEQPGPSIPERPEGAVAVAITGTPASDGSGSLELCPPGQSRDCAGIPVDGVLELPPDATIVRVEGWYDGARLVPTGPAEPAGFPGSAEADYTTPCVAMRDGGFRDNPRADVSDAVSAYVAGLPDRYAGTWWDGANGVLTVWLVGEAVEADRVALESLSDEICVAGGASYSEAELLKIFDELPPLLDGYGVRWSGMSLDTLANRVGVYAEEVDQAVLEAIASTYGDRVSVGAFLEMREGRLADLPGAVAARPGAVPLITSELRSGAGMDALGTFALQFDTELGCVYLGDADEQILPVWPFGYTADGSPVVIYDQDGMAVAREGDMLEMGGGFGSITAYPESVRCGAAEVWEVNPYERPRVTG